MLNCRRSLISIACPIWIGTYHLKYFKVFYKLTVTSKNLLSFSHFNYFLCVSIFLCLAICVLYVSNLLVCVYIAVYFTH